MKKIIYIDTLSTGSFHEIFNASVFNYLSNQKKYKVEYFVNQSSYNAAKNILTSNNIVLTNVSPNFLKLPQQTSSFHILFKLILGVIYALKIYSKYRKDNVKFLFAQFNPVLIFFISFFTFVFKRVDIQFICHGELEYVIQKAPFYKPLFWYKKMLRYSLDHLQPNIKLILLGESIKSNLCELFSIPSKQITVIDHPYIYSKSSKFNESNFEYLCGTVGSISVSKGLNNILDFSRFFTETDMPIYLVGSHGGNIGSSKAIKFAFTPNYFATNIEFLKEARKMKIMLFFYDVHTYKLTASGALFDAVKLNKPIIALKNDYFEYLFDKFGDIGYLCENINEMYEKMILLRNDSGMIQTFNKNIENWKSNTSLNSFDLYL